MNLKAGVSIVLYIIIILFAILLNFQQETYAQSKLLPVILLHGYFDDATVWNTWERLLKQDGITFFTVTFANDDKCGSAASHAIELQEIVQNISQLTGSEKVNIAAHSKGGLDARAYLSKDGDNVANLIMIGTPNAGIPLAFLNNFCAPAVWDLRPGASVDEAPRNPHTKYYTISGDWLPLIGGNFYIPGPDDGLVSVSSVESKSYFESLGRTLNNHMDLLGRQEYDLARGKLMGK
jgi:pimeloyl-ACP methyl ester carboxylesterase